MLRIEHLSKSYGEKKAVDDLSLHIAPGEIYGFIGHNGAGKTTTLKSVAGILEFDAGEILIDGHSIVREPMLCKQRFAYIPDNPDLYEYLTAAQYLNFVSDVYGVGKEQRQERIHTYTSEFEIEENLNQQISSLSHGMKQKLAITAALVHLPKLHNIHYLHVGQGLKSSHIVK